MHTSTEAPELGIGLPVFRRALVYPLSPALAERDRRYQVASAIGATWRDIVEERGAEIEPTSEALQTTKATRSSETPKLMRHPKGTLVVLELPDFVMTQRSEHHEFGVHGNLYAALCPPPHQVKMWARLSLETIDERTALGIDVTELSIVVDLADDLVSELGYLYAEAARKVGGESVEPPTFGLRVDAISTDRVAFQKALHQLDAGLIESVAALADHPELEAVREISNRFHKLEGRPQRGYPSWLVRHCSSGPTLYRVNLSSLEFSCVGVAFGHGEKNLPPSDRPTRESSRTLANEFAGEI